jgi:rhodanese-related sulfurtransferase
VDRAFCSSGGHSGARCAPRRSLGPPATDGQPRPRRPVKHSPEFLKLVNDAKSRVREVDVAQARRGLESGKAKLIDVREESEWGAGHARGAEHMGKGVIERDVEERFPDKNAEVILYCGGGFRSALAADNLQKMGYTKVASMAGGWRAWQAAGAPVEKGK